MLMHFLERPDDVIHVGARPKEKILPEPNTLFAADQITVGTMGPAIVEPAARLRKVGSESALTEERLMRQRETVAGRAGNPLGLQGAHHGGSRRPELPCV